MTPVDDLRSAAALLRQQAEHALRMMPAPWRVVLTDSESADGVASCPLHVGGPQDVCDSCSVILTYSEWVAPYVARLHPAVGLALADHLDAVAASAAWLDAKVSEPLLRLARLILAGGGS
jgi:hypothetical protein